MITEVTAEERAAQMHAQRPALCKRLRGGAGCPLCAPPAKQLFAKLYRKGWKLSQS